jgi:hypothetical protein
VSPGSGSTAGGQSVTVTGTGLLSGATVIKFGTAKATVVSCSSWDPTKPALETTCTVQTPPHAAGTVNVKAIVNKASSPTSAGDRFTYS